MGFGVPIFLWDVIVAPPIFIALGATENNYVVHIIHNFHTISIKLLNIYIFTTNITLFNYIYRNDIHIYDIYRFSKYSCGHYNFIIERLDHKHYWKDSLFQVSHIFIYLFILQLSMEYSKLSPLSLLSVKIIVYTYLFTR